MSTQAARSERDAAIDRVATGSGATWQETAYNALVAYAKGRDGFLAEDVRLAATDVPKPRDNRAWGAVFNRAVRAGLIRRIGYGQAATGHCRPMPIWKGVG